MMKYKNRLLYLFMLSALVWGAGCEDYRLNNMVDDKIYLNSFGLNPQNIYKWEGYTYTLNVNKSGVGQQSGEVQLTLDETLLTQYGTTYTLLPSEMYKIKTSKLNLSTGDYQVPFEIEFNAAAIEALAASTKMLYALPVKLTSPNNSLKLAADAQTFSVIVPTVLDAYIGFKVSGLTATKSVVNMANSPAEMKFYSFVTTNYNNKWDLTYKVAVDAEALTAFNTANKTAHNLLPADAYRIDAGSLKVQNLNNEGAISYFIKKAGAPIGEYVLPLTITEVSKNGVNPAKKTTLIPVSIQN